MSVYVEGRAARRNASRVRDGSRAGGRGWCGAQGDGPRLLYVPGRAHFCRISCYEQSSEEPVHGARCSPARPSLGQGPVATRLPDDLLDLISISEPESLNRVVAAQRSRRDPAPPSAV